MTDACFLGLILTAIHTVSSDTGYFWHTTDLHYDFSYHERQLSCNSEHMPSNPGQFGDFWCDSPWALINSSVKAMANIKPGVDFVLWTGDTILHGTDEELNYTINAAILDNTTDILRTSLPGVPVYASFGNHEYWPKDQFPPTNNLLYNDTLKRWSGWINDTSQDENFLKGAYYTVVDQHGLRIIALNTNLYYLRNKAVLNVSDPADQLAWLNTTLARASHEHEKVLITAHIAPGVHAPEGIAWMYDKYHQPLLAILRQYADVIVGMHFGHDHADGFKVLLNNQGQPSAPLFIAPSVTPWRYTSKNKHGPAHNPGIRLVKYDRTTGVHLDIEQYYLDLVKANQDGIATWELEYKASTQYGTKRLTANDLHTLVNKMKTSTGNEFENYWMHFSVSPPSNLRIDCNKDCHAAIICGFTEFEMVAFRSCKANMISGAWRPRWMSHLFVFCHILPFIWH